MRNIQKVIATGISVAMTATMCVAVPATAAFADEAVTTAEGEEAAELQDINDVISTSYSLGEQFYMDGPVTPVDSISKKYSSTGNKLTAGVDYDVVYENNDKLGTATATLTGKESAGLTGTKTMTFEIVNFYINVTYKNEAGETKALGTLSWEKIQSLMASAEDNAQSVCYQYGTTVCYVPAKQYLTFDDIMRGVGVTGWNSVVASATDGFASPAVSAEVNENGKFYPAQTTTGYNVDGAVKVPAILAFSSSDADIETTAAAAATVAAEAEPTKAAKLFSGILESDYVNGQNMGGNRFATGVCNFAIDSYTPLKANTITAKASKSTVKNNKKQTVQIKTSKAKGTVSYSVSSAPSKKAVKVSKKGVVTIAKGAKTGKYVIAVKAAGNKDYKAKTVKVTIKVTK